MCTTNASTMPDSSNDDDAVKLGSDLVSDVKGYFKGHMQVVPPSSYVEEETRLAGLESDYKEEEDENGVAKKKKKKKKKHRKNKPLDGVLVSSSVKHSKKHEKHSKHINDVNGNGIETDLTDASSPKKRKKHKDNVSKKDMGHAGDDGEKGLKKHKKQNDNVIKQEMAHEDNDGAEGSKKRKRQNDNVIKQETVIEDDDGAEDVKPPKKEKSQDGGSVYRQGMSLSEAVQAKHEAKKKSKTTKWRKNRPIEKEVTRRKARLEEKLMKLKAKCEELKALKNSGQSVMRREKRLMSKERKLSSELGVISGSKKERKRKLLERRMTLAEGLRSPHGPPILNSNGAPVKSKFDFSIFSMGNDKARSSNLHGRDYKRLLETVEKRQEEVQELKQKDEEKAKKLEEKMAWQAMMSRARGEKVKDDPKMLKRSLKKAEKMKEKRKKKWEERTAKVEEAKEAKQRKRQANLDKRKSDKQDKKRKKAIKKGRYIPGFGWGSAKK